MQNRHKILVVNRFLGDIPLEKHSIIFRRTKKISKKNPRLKKSKIYSREISIKLSSKIKAK